MNHINRIVETSRSYFKLSIDKSLSVKIGEHSRGRATACNLRKEPFVVELLGEGLDQDNLSAHDFKDH
jgi:hypothetical protein